MNKPEEPVVSTNVCMSCVACMFRRSPTGTQYAVYVGPEKPQAKTWIVTGFLEATLSYQVGPHVVMGVDLPISPQLVRTIGPRDYMPTLREIFPTLATAIAITLRDRFPSMPYDAAHQPGDEDYIYPDRTQPLQAPRVLRHITYLPIPEEYMQEFATLEQLVKLADEELLPEIFEYTYYNAEAFRVARRGAD